MALVLADKMPFLSTNHECQSTKGNIDPTVTHFMIHHHHQLIPSHTHTHRHTRFMALFPGPSGWAGARRELLDFMVQRKINRGRHIDHPAGRHSIQTNQCPPPPYHQSWKISANSRGCNDARQLRSVWRNLDRDDVERHPRRLDADTVWSRLHAVEMIRAVLLRRGHVSAVDYDASAYHSQTLHNDRRHQPQYQHMIWPGKHTEHLNPETPFPSNRHHRSSGDCLDGKRENYQVCSVQYCVQQLCTVNCTHIWTD